MREQKYTDIFNLIFLSILFLSSFYFGYKYSLFNTDIHHYSIVLETYLDKVNGYKLNKDIFIIYGNGQIYLYELLSNFININIVNIGIITQFFFSAKFFLFFFILKYFVNNFFSIAGTLIYYFLYTFAQTASGDVYASFFLHLFVIFYLYNSKQQNLFLILFTSFILFLVIYFRHTYILNFVTLIPLIFTFNFFFKNKFSYEIKINNYFLIILSVFFIYLYFQNTLFNWLDQFLGIGLTNFLNINSSNSDIFSNIYKIIYYFLRIIKHIVVPTSYGSNYFYSIIILFNVYFIITFFIKYFFNKSFLSQKDKFLFFLSILAACGTIQLINKFETGRYINTSFAFIIIFVYIIAQFYKKNKYKFKKNFYLILLLILFVPTLLKYPFSSNYYSFDLDKYEKHTEFYFNNDYFLKSKQTFFENKYFNNDFIKFYSDIKNTICNYEIIYNLSFDRSFQYLCDSKKKYVSTLLFKLQNDQFNINEYLKNYDTNKILISHELYEELNLIQIFQIPKYYRYTKADKYMVFFPDKIYIYE